MEKVNANGVKKRFMEKVVPMHRPKSMNTTAVRMSANGVDDPSMEKDVLMHPGMFTNMDQETINAFGAVIRT